MWCGYLTNHLVNYMASFISPAILCIPFGNNLRTEAIEREAGRREEKLSFLKVSAHVYSGCLLLSTEECQRTVFLHSETEQVEIRAHEMHKNCMYSFECQSSDGILKEP